MDEIWRDIPGYEGAYQVSNLGRVRSLDRLVKRKDGHGNTSVDWQYKGRILSTRPKTCGHLVVGLGANNTKLVHRLVLLAFVGPPQEGEECLHGDGNPANNRLENLRWGTRRENKRDERDHNIAKNRVLGSSRLSKSTVAAIREDLAKTPALTFRELADKYGVHFNTIGNIKRGVTHAHIN